MNELEDIAQSALEGDALRVRSLVQDWLLTDPRFETYPRPDALDGALLAIAASIVELLAERAGQKSPSWSLHVGALAQPLHLLKSSASMPRLRKYCESQAPQALLKRRLFAPPNYLEFV